MAAMMFPSLGAFAVHLAAARLEVAERMLHGMHVIVDAIQYTARSEFGSYQPGVGGHPAWAELADSTKAERVKLGFMPNLPLHRTGELQMAIATEVVGLNGVIGVRSGTTHSPYKDGGSTPDMGELMSWQEFGTSRMPPRPVLGPAAVRNLDLIQYTIGAAVVMGLGVRMGATGLGYGARVRT